MTERTILKWDETNDWMWCANDWRIYRESPEYYEGFALYYGPITSAYCLKHSIPTLEAAKDLAQRLQDTLDGSPRKMRYWFFDDGGPDEPLSRDARRPEPSSKEPPDTANPANVLSDGLVLDDDLAEYRALGSGALADDWDDKPHRLVFDLIRLAQVARNERDARATPPVTASVLNAMIDNAVFDYPAPTQISPRQWMLNGARLLRDDLLAYLSQNKAGSPGTLCKFKIGDVLRYQAWGGFDQPTITKEQAVDAVVVRKDRGIYYEFFQGDGVIQTVDEKDCELVSTSVSSKEPQ